jgi:hypothetical protein
VNTIMKLRVLGGEFIGRLRGYHLLCPFSYHHTWNLLQYPYKLLLWYQILSLLRQSLHIETYGKFVQSLIKARRMRWAGNVARMGVVRGAYNILVGRPEGRRPLGRPGCRWEDNIKMDLREIRFGDVDWIRWVQDRDRWRALVITVMNLRVP